MTISVNGMAGWAISFFFLFLLSCLILLCRYDMYIYIYITYLGGSPKQYTKRMEQVLAHYWVTHYILRGPNGGSRF